MAHHIASDDQPDLFYSLKDLFRIRRTLDRQLALLEKAVGPAGAGPSSPSMDGSTVARGDGAGDDTPDGPT